MTKYDFFLKKHKEAKTEIEQKALLQEFLFSLSPYEMMKWYMETPDIIEKNLNELIHLEGENGQQEAREFLASAIDVLKNEGKSAKVAA